MRPVFSCNHAPNKKYTTLKACKNNSKCRQEGCLHCPNLLIEMKIDEPEKKESTKT